MLKQEFSQNNESKEMYIKPDCNIYEIELEGCILSASGGDSGTENTSVGNASVNSFLPGASYETSVF